MDDFFTIRVKRTDQRIDLLLEEIKEARKSLIADIQRGIGDGRCSGVFKFWRYKRGSMEREIATGRFSGFAYQNSGWIAAKVKRRDGSFGDHKHPVDPDDIIEFEITDSKDGASNG